MRRKFDDDSPTVRRFERRANEVGAGPREERAPVLRRKDEVRADFVQRPKVRVDEKGIANGRRRNFDVVSPITPVLSDGEAFGASRPKIASFEERVRDFRNVLPFQEFGVRFFRDSRRESRRFISAMRRRNEVDLRRRVEPVGDRIKEVPIIFVDRKEGTSKMSSGIFGEAFWGVLKLKMRKIKPRA